jgi:ribosomal protein S12 methylthiotransferase accessory factor
MSFLNVEFPGGLRVDARLKNHVIKTDQPVRGGGEGSAPTPFELFLGSIATCAGIYALGFCKNKGLSTEGMNLSMELEMNRATGMIDKVNMDLKLPEGFPEKYRSAIVRSMDLCAVKMHMQQPPEFEITTTLQMKRA